jgi:hypothetical protein
MVKVAPMTKEGIISSATGSARFLKWLRFILDWECEIDRKTGKIIPEDMHDGAGITVAGLTARDDSFPASGITEPWVSNTYKTEYWNKCLGDALPDPVGSVLANFGVNCGIETAVTMLQLTACDYGQRITCDGKLGEQTLAAVFKISNSKEVAYALIGKADGRYRRLATHRPETYARDLQGWLNRDEALRKLYCS